MGLALPDRTRSRLDFACGQMRELGADGVLVTNMVNVRWLSGFTGSEAALVLKRRSQWLLTDSRYVTQAKREAAGYQVVMTTRRDKDVAGLVGSKKIERLAFEPDGMTHARFLLLRREMKGVRLVRLREPFIRRRAVKDGSEARLIKRAAGIAARAFEECLGELKPGVRERDFAALLEGRMRELGSGQVPFPTIVASGPRGALPHGIAAERKMKRGDLVTVDFGSVYGGYQSDQTVTVCLGRPSKKQRQVYETVREAQARAIDLIRPGARAKDVDRAARGLIVDRGYGKYFGHGLGHGVGLETHEGPVLNPTSTDVLEEGMVVTVEPGIYIPGLCGVRIEDMVLVTSRGCKSLTDSSGPLREL